MLHVCITCKDIPFVPLANRRGPPTSYQRHQFFVSYAAITNYSFKNHNARNSSSHQIGCCICTLLPKIIKNCLNIQVLVRNACFRYWFWLFYRINRFCNTRSHIVHLWGWCSLWNKVEAGWHSRNWWLEDLRCRLLVKLNFIKRYSWNSFVSCGTVFGTCGAAGGSGCVIEFCGNRTLTLI